MPKTKTVQKIETPYGEILEIFWKGQKVVTYDMIDTLHEKAKGSAKTVFGRHRKHFIEGSDFFHLTYQQLTEKYLVDTFSRRGLNVLTESGYLKIVKVFDDDLSWTVYKKLVECYFQVNKTEKQITREKAKALLHMPEAYIHDEVRTENTKALHSIIAQTLGRDPDYFIDFHVESFERILGQYKMTIPEFKDVLIRTHNLTPSSKRLGIHKLLHKCGLTAQASSYSLSQRVLMTNPTIKDVNIQKIYKQSVHFHAALLEAQVNFLIPEVTEKEI